MREKEEEGQPQPKGGWTSNERSSCSYESRIVTCHRLD